MQKALTNVLDGCSSVDSCSAKVVGFFVLSYSTVSICFTITVASNESDAPWRSGRNLSVGMSGNIDSPQQKWLLEQRNWAANHYCVKLKFSFSPKETIPQILFILRYFMLILQNKIIWVINCQIDDSKMQFVMVN